MYPSVRFFHNGLAFRVSLGLSWIILPTRNGIELSPKSSIRVIRLTLGTNWKYPISIEKAFKVNGQFSKRESASV